MAQREPDEESRVGHEREIVGGSGSLESLQHLFGGLLGLDAIVGGLELCLGLEEIIRYPSAPSAGLAYCADFRAMGERSDGGRGSEVLSECLDGSLLLASGGSA